MISAVDEGSSAMEMRARGNEVRVKAATKKVSTISAAVEIRTR